MLMLGFQGKLKEEAEKLGVKLPRFPRDFNLLLQQQKANIMRGITYNYTIAFNRYYG